MQQQPVKGVCKRGWGNTVAPGVDHRMCPDNSSFVILISLLPGGGLSFWDILNHVLCMGYRPEARTVVGGSGGLGRILSPDLISCMLSTATCSGKPDALKLEQPWRNGFRV